MSETAHPLQWPAGRPRTERRRSDPAKMAELNAARAQALRELQYR